MVLQGSPADYYAPKQQATKRMRKTGDLIEKLILVSLGFVLGFITAKGGASGG